MFGPSKNLKTKHFIPRNCSFRVDDWEILSRCWHPVAFTSDIKSEPFKAKLLDVELVIYKTSFGITVARDICPHRGTKLSNGYVRDDTLICPMHGLRYDNKGGCTKIPSAGTSAKRMPPRMHLQTLKSENRYGIIWACFSNEPIFPIPKWPGIGETSSKNLYIPNDTWNAAASRHVENFNDVAHFPFVHKETFGGYEDDPIPKYEVKKTNYGLTFDLPYLEEGNRFPDGIQGKNRKVVYTYELSLPFSSIIIIKPVEGKYVQYFADTVCPISAYETKIFQVVTDTTDEPNADFLIKESVMINNEDKLLVESQKPEDLPLDLRDEVHIPADTMSVYYRRALSQMGLGAPFTS